MSVNIHEPVRPKEVLLGLNKGIKVKSVLLYVGILFRLGEGFLFFLYFSLYSSEIRVRMEGAMYVDMDLRARSSPTGLVIVFYLLFFKCRIHIAAVYLRRSS